MQKTPLDYTHDMTRLTKEVTTHLSPRNGGVSKPWKR